MSGNPRLLIVGPYPPPVGGISTHVRRLVDRARASGWQAELLGWTHSGWGVGPGYVLVPAGCAPIVVPGILAFARRKVDLVHFHFSSFQRAQYVADAWRWGTHGLPYVVTIHGGRWASSAERMGGGVRRLLRKANAIVAVNEEIEVALRSELGAETPPIRICPAYLPEVPVEVAGKVAGEVSRFLDRHRLIIVSSGSLTEVYGFHTVLEAVAGMPDEWGVILATYGPVARGYAASLQAGMGGRVLLLQDVPANQFLSLLRCATALVRATSVDGDAVVIREALSLGIPVVATDVVPRPGRVVLFRYGDASGLRRALEAVTIRPDVPPESRQHSGEWAALVAVYKFAAARSGASVEEGRTIHSGMQE